MNTKVMFFCKSICWFLFGSIISDALSPESLLIENRDYRLLLIDSYVIDDIDDLFERKQKQIENDGFIENNILIEQFIEKEILVAKKNAILLKHCLSSQEYYHHFSYILDRIDKSCEFFQIDMDLFFKIFMGDHKKERLFHGFKNFLKYVDSIENREALLDSHGKLPSASSIDESNYYSFLTNMIKAFKKNRFSIKRRTEAVLRLKTGNIVKVNNDYFMNECLKTFDFFIHSQSFAADFYDELLTFKKQANINFSSLENAYLEKQSDQQKEILKAVKKHGSINYSTLMQVLLYDDKFGFYTKDRQGSIAGGDFGFGQEFSTIPENSPLFGNGVAIDCFQRWIVMGKPATFFVVEMGAGEGGLAFNFLRTVLDRKDDSKEWALFFKSLQYKIIDVNTARILDFRKKFLDKYVDFIEGDAIHMNRIFSKNSITGVFLSNELVDAFPVHKIRMVDGVLKEIFIKEKNGYLIEVEENIQNNDLIKYLDINNPVLMDGQEMIINLLSMKWLKNLNYVLNRGYILTFDYGALTMQKALTLNLFQPLFRLFGAARENVEISFFGVPKSMGDEIFGIDPYEEFLSQSGIMNEDDIKKDLYKAFSERNYILKEYFNSPLVRPFDLDITTDVSFVDMQNIARYLGFSHHFSGEQKEYFDKLRDDDTVWNKKVPEGSYFLEDLDGYFVQVLQKKSNFELNCKKTDRKILYAS